MFMLSSLRSVSSDDIFQRKATLLHAIDQVMAHARQIRLQVEDVGRDGQRPDLALHELEVAEDALRRITGRRWGRK